MPTGKLKWFDTARGFGFIKPDDEGPDVFLHLSKVTETNLPTLHPGTSLRYSLGRHDSKVFAQNVSLVSVGESAASTVRAIDSDADFATEFEKEWGLRRS
jgi:CspA family cold shock protein